jgi:hypothetical protein
VDQAHRAGTRSRRSAAAPVSSAESAGARLDARLGAALDGRLDARLGAALDGRLGDRLGAALDGRLDGRLGDRLAVERSAPLGRLRIRP